MTQIQDEQALLPCGGCGKEAGALETDSGIFKGQSYHDRYPVPVATQNNGFKIRCEYCGLQTCWWHYEEEAVTHWNTRSLPALIAAAKGMGYAVVPVEPTRAMQSAGWPVYVMDGRSLNALDIIYRAMISASQGEGE